MSNNANATIKKCEDGIAAAIKTAIDVIEEETGLKVGNVLIEVKQNTHNKGITFTPNFRLESR